jgi:glycosyltransferase involved in cell wall biosynthesis
MNGTVNRTVNGAVNAVHQFVPTLDPGAVGTHTRCLQEVLRGMGLASEIYAEEVQGLTVDVPHVREYRPRDRELLVYQSAIGSFTADYLGALETPLVVNYHNITPPAYGWSVDDHRGQQWGRAQVRRLGEHAVLGLSDSHYNRAELVEAGYRRTEVAPVLVDLDGPDPDPAVLRRLRASRRGLELVFVGRIAPNKAQHDLIKALAAYRRLYDPDAQLRLVGAAAVPRYRTALAGFVKDLGLGEAVTFTGSVSPGELAAHYANADVFVCLSEHEGFCVPLLEAMHHEVPVIAYAAAAVPETLAGAGVLLADKSPATVAAAIHAVASDDSLRAELAAAGTARLADFHPARTRARYVELFDELLAG